jgi:Uncharacterized protein conserved in bacteria
MRFLVHADDYGFTEGMNRAIASCLEAGCIDGAAIMAGSLEDGLVRSLSQMPPRHGVPALGVHVSLFETRPVSLPERIPLLAAPDGTFRHSLGSLARALVAPGSARERLLDQIHQEWTAQIDWVLERAPETAAALYLDGHQHVHCLPALRPVLSALLERYPVLYARVPSEHRHKVPGPLRLQVLGTVRRGILRHWSRGLRAFLDTRGVRTADAFIGAFASTCLTYDRVCAALRSLPASIGQSDALVEIMVHPDALPPESGPRPYPAADRNTEYAMLRSPEFRTLMLEGSRGERQPLP